MATFGFSHTAEATLDVLCPVFEDHIVNRRADIDWPPVALYFTNVLKNWTDRVGYCMASRGSYLN